jgi:uncharacterized protein YndB with AHSA1/START domain
MKDILQEISAIQREVSRYPDGDSESVSVALRRSYPSDVEDLWEAVTSPGRIKRWFAPVTGDFREGGTFQVEGNASGEILKCAQPRLLKFTYGGPSSIVEVTLTPASATETVLEIRHAVPITLARNGAGALWTGPGWDGGILALTLYLRGDGPEDPVAAENTLERQEFLALSAHAWADAVTLSGTATDEEIAANLAVSLKQFAPDLPESS